MAHLRNTWYLAAWSHMIEKGKIFKRTIINVPLVFFRQSDGTVACLEDRCPHRFAPLSMGHLSNDDNNIVCGYHGLTFNGAGTCVQNPHPSGKIPAAAKVQSFPVHEVYSGVWIWMGDGPADPATIPDFSILNDSDNVSAAKLDHIVMRASYELVVDNLLDCSHTCFVHEGLLGNEGMIDTPTEFEQENNSIRVKRYSRNVPMPGIFSLLYAEEEKLCDTWTDIRWHPPACMSLDVGVTLPGKSRAEGTGYLSTHIVTPETDRTAHYHFASQRWNPLPGSETEEIKAKFSEIRRFAFLEQDEPMIRAQQQIIDMTPPEKLKKPVMLETDVGVVRWRRIIESLMQQDRALT